MASCPFCHASVDEPLVVYGGTCPHCFAHIPGEEAATDPGDDVKEAQQRADHARTRRRVLLPVLVALVVAGVLFVAALTLALMPEPDLALIDFDDTQYYIPSASDLIIAKPKPKRPPPRPPKASDPGDAQPTADDAQPTADDALDALAQLSPAPATPHTPTVPRQPLVDTTPTTQAPGQSPSMALTPVPSPTLNTSTPKVGDRPLSEPKAIVTMIQTKLYGNIPKLSVCYETQLKANPELAGRWTLRFVVLPDGTTKQAQAQGQDLTHQALESCLVRKITKWRFDPIYAKQPVKKTIAFKKG